MAEQVSSRVPSSGPDASGAPLPASLERVLHSHTFERTPTLRVLLAYLWRNRERPIGEYAIATEALGRSPSFDAKIDATVRVQISRLRQRLERYYAEEGKESPERIVIPVGSHQIEIEVLASVPAVMPAPVPLPVVVEHRRNLSRPLAAICLMLMGACVWLGVELARARAKGTPQEAPRFWRAFHNNGRPTRIVLTSPVFYAVGSFMIRETSINEYAEGLTSPRTQELWKNMGKPGLASNYTVTSDTYASISLVRYLDRFSFPTRVLSTADAPLEALDSENVVAVGTWGTLTPLKTYLDQMGIHLARGEGRAEIRNPRKGEPSAVDYVREGYERAIWPGVVGLLPGRGGRTRLLVAASRHTSALIYALTSTNGLEQIDRLWKAKGSPEFFEMVINLEMNGDSLVRAWPAVLRPFQRK